MPSGYLHPRTEMTQSNCGTAECKIQSTMQGQIVFEQGS